MKYTKKISLCLVVLLVLFNIAGAAQTAYAAPAGGLLGALVSPTLPGASGGAGGTLNIIDTLLGLLVDKILGPILNILGGGGKNAAANNDPHVTIKPLPPKETAGSANSGSLKGKVIVIDPGHGGSNPGAVANGFRESDNNLAVGLKLRDRLAQSGAKVIMTRDTDRMVDPSGTTLSEELAARVKIADKNNADIFVSIHTNYNPDSSVTGAMTFYHSSQSRDLAQKIQNGLTGETGAADKGIETASFHVIRNTAMPGVLVEMGFISNAAEAELLGGNNYRNKIAKGIYNGIVKYFDK